MKLALGALLLIACTSTDNEPHKAEFSHAQVCADSAFYFKPEPQPNRWEVYRVESDGQDTSKVRVDIRWDNKKGLLLNCGALVVRYVVFWD